MNGATIVVWYVVSYFILVIVSFAYNVFYSLETPDTGETDERFQNLDVDVNGKCFFFIMIQVSNFPSYYRTVLSPKIWM